MVFARNCWRDAVSACSKAAAKSAYFGLIVGLTLSACIGLPAAADELSTQQIIDALKPSRVTRALISPADLTRIAQDVRTVDAACNRPPRSLIAYDKLDTIIKNRPNVDLEISFEYNSDKIGADAISLIMNFGRALSSTDLMGSTFLLAGHTDAKGSAAYNQDLSKRRAVALKRYLLGAYSIDADKLVPCGYGKTRPKTLANPYAAENRRVQVVNLSAN
jgi:outer membrane protein OmpA-like peptidoglycan-associated protein